MQPYNVLFICQHNVFRSQIAEAYLEQHGLPFVRVSSGGLFPHHDLETEQVGIARDMGINLRGKPKGITTKILGGQDLVVIVADCIPKSIIAPGVYSGPIEVWNTPDEPVDHGDKTRRIIKQIQYNVDILVDNINRGDYNGE